MSAGEIELSRLPPRSNPWKGKLARQGKGLVAGSSYKEVPLRYLLPSPTEAPPSPGSLPGHLAAPPSPEPPPTPSPASCGSVCGSKQEKAGKALVLRRVRTERVGFEPTRRLPAYTLSKRAPSTTRPPLPDGALKGGGNLRAATVLFKQTSLSRRNAKGRGICLSQPVVWPGTVAPGCGQRTRQI